MIPVDSQKRRVAEAELRRDERLLWVGQPNPLRIALKSLPQLLFGILWMAVIIFMISAIGGFGSVGGGFFSIFSLVLFIFAIVGLGMLASPLWSYFKAMRTVYAVTDRRIMMIEQTFSTSVKSYGEDNLEFVERRMRSDHDGDVIFTREHRTSRTRSSSGFYRTRHYTVDVGFFGIPDAREVEQLLLDNFRADARRE
ncbi:MAG: hypothetical protein JXB47_01485 [Anaerolineae bacterium]|nr:hypothetical protein [Anaerolineae bacterium]